MPPSERARLLIEALGSVPASSPDHEIHEGLNLIGHEIHEGLNLIGHLLDADTLMALRQIVSTRLSASTDSVRAIDTAVARHLAHLPDVRS